MQGGMSVRGAVSGFEVDEVIEQMMELERRPIERMERQGQEVLEKQEVWGEVDARAREFQDALRPMRERWNFLQREATSSDESVVTAVAEDNVEEATYNIDVKQLATTHSVGTSEGFTDPGEALGIEGDFFLDTGADVTEIEELTLGEETREWLSGDPSTGFYTEGLEPGEEYSLDIDALEFDEEELGAEVERVDVYAHSLTDAEGQGKLEELEEYYLAQGKDFNEEEPLFTLERDENGHWQALDQWGDEFSISADFPEGVLELDAEFVGSGENEGEEEVLKTRQFDFRHGEDAVSQQQISIDETDSLNEIAEQINILSEHTGVGASIIMKAEGDHRLVLESKEEGTDGKIQTWSQDNVLEELQLDQELVEAQDAEFEFNGMNIERTSNTVDDLVDGMEFHIEGEGEATVSVDTDTEGPREMIENFISTYNDFNSILRQVQEDDDQESPFEEEEGVQERGALRGDTTLKRIESRLRSTIHGHVPEIEEGETPFNSLAEIGISAGAPSTEEQDYMESAEGFLDITDEEALNQALRDDPEGVFELFGRRAPEDEDGNPKGPDGLARQMEDYLGSMVGPGGIIDNRQNELSRQVSDLEDRMERVEQRVQRRKDRMIQQFTAMERHINRIQGQDMAMTAIGDGMGMQQPGGEEE